MLKFHLKSQSYQKNICLNLMIRQKIIDNKDKLTIIPNELKNGWKSCRIHAIIYIFVIYNPFPAFHWIDIFIFKNIWETLKNKNSVVFLVIVKMQRPWSDLKPIYCSILIAMCCLQCVNVIYIPSHMSCWTAVSICQFAVLIVIAAIGYTRFMHICVHDVTRQIYTEYWF